jgi:hypothetical protein
MGDGDQLGLPLTIWTGMANTRPRPRPCPRSPCPSSCVVVRKLSQQFLSNQGSSVDLAVTNVGICQNIVLGPVKPAVLPCSLHIAIPAQKVWSQPAHHPVQSPATPGRPLQTLPLHQFGTWPRSAFDPVKAINLKRRAKKLKKIWIKAVLGHAPALQTYRNDSAQKW